MNYILDTNIITALLKSNVRVKEKIVKVLIEGNDIFINGISYYEIKRGLLAINAKKKLKLFENFCNKFGLLLLDSKFIFDEASKIYANLKNRGELIKDADILIASITKNKKCVLVTDDSDFDRISNIIVENWI